MINKRLLIVYFSYSAATSAIGLLSALILLRFMSPDEFGRIALFASIQFLVLPIISFSAEGLIPINKTKLSSTEYKNFKNSYITLSCLIFAVVQICFFALKILDSKILLIGNIYLLVPIAALLKYLIVLKGLEYIIDENSSRYGLMQFFTAALSLVLSIGFIIFIEANAFWRILALIVTDTFVVMVLYRVKSKILIELVVNKEHRRQIIKFGIPLLLSIGPAWILNEADKLIVAKTFDLTAVGLYSAACAIGNFMITFNTSLLNATMPKLYKELNSHTQPLMSVLNRFLITHFLSSLLFAGCFSLGYGLLAEIILPEKYAAAREIVYWIILFALARSFYAILGAVIDYMNMTREKLKGIIFGAAASIVGMYIGILKFGIVGAAVGVGLGYSVLGLSLWLSLLNKENIKSST